MDQPQNPGHPGAVNPQANAAPPHAVTTDARADGVVSPDLNGRVAPEPPPPPLTFTAWLTQNGVYLVLLGAAVGLIAYKFGLDGLWRILLVALGLGVIVFIHELGHFLAAKWCDVHVQTFSLGFGPALPGCSFRYGETLYKIAVLPLGGYVSMVGEGTEADEDADYPRSFKNKTVGQRMLIISAGVIMNALFACVAFTLVYRLHGIAEPTGVVAMTEAGSPAWKKGVPTGSVIKKAGNTENPNFDKLRRAVILSSWSKPIPFVFQKIGDDGPPLSVDIEPRKDQNDSAPVIGVGSSFQLRLRRAEEQQQHALPVAYNSAAAAARAVDLRPGDVVLKATDPDADDKLTPVSDDPKDPAKGLQEVCRRMRKLGGRPLVLEVRRKGTDKPEEVNVPPVGFEWDDYVVGTTDADQPKDAFDPLAVKELPVVVTQENKQLHDFFEFRRRLKQTAGLPIVVQVRRKGEGNPVNLLTPPEYHRVLGVRMRMGEVAAVRDNSPAANADLKPGDVIVRVLAKDGDGGHAREFKNFDPARLPFELSRWAAGVSGTKTVTLTVDRPNPPGGPGDGSGDAGDKHQATKEVTLDPMIWDAGWDFDEEDPGPSASAQAIPQLGIAYRIDATVVEVAKDSPAEKAGLKEGDEVTDIRFRESGKIADELSWGDWQSLQSKRGPNSEKRLDRWAFIFFALQLYEHNDVQLKVKRGSAELTIPANLEQGSVMTERDESWPLSERGLLLRPDTRLKKADSVWQAVLFGFEDTADMIWMTYVSLPSIGTRVSIDQVQGPVNIAKAAYSTTADPDRFLNIIPYRFFFFMGVISVSLAAVNFLPIPILDGGHMVFLIYEKIRRRPPSDTFRNVANIIGLAFILLIMAALLLKEAVIPLFRLLTQQ